MVYDVTSTQSFDSINEWYATFVNHCGEPQESLPVLLLGN
jgi:GTPase SAR1 family protein